MLPGGTLQNRQGPIFEAIAAACAGLDAQLVLSLGSHDQRLELKLAGTPIVVPFAPQLELLKRATLTITHAGLNTALGSLSQGVPPVRLTTQRLRAKVKTVLHKSHYPRESAAMESTNQL
jgi:zeaxanthin glucosyltransferase